MKKYATINVLIVIYIMELVMKKLLLILGLLLVSCNVSYAQEVSASEPATVKTQVDEVKGESTEDVKLLNVITTIGILVVDDKLDEAFDKCNEALKIYPDNAELYSWRASVLSDKKQHFDALADIEKAVALAPDNLDYHIKRAMIMSDLGNRTGAIDEIDYVISKDPKKGTAYLMRSVFKMQMGDYSGASADLEKGNLYLDEELADIQKELEEIDCCSGK